MPLPSIGHEHADQQIRRVLVEVPGDCPLRAEDVAWAFSGQALKLHGRDVDLVRAQTNRQLEHYGITPSKPSRSWQTVTPVALSSATRRRIEPDENKRSDTDKKGAAERRFEQERATSALVQSLRHAGVTAHLSSVQLQREPFSSRGQRADTFQSGDRFSKHSLWHARLEFEQSVSGPMVIGDGRYMGLGLFEPSESLAGVFAFSIDSGLVQNADPVRLCKSLRRAVMSRVRDVLRTTNLPTYFSGHSNKGTPADSKSQPHLTYLFDPMENRLMILQPEVIDTAIERSRKHAQTLELALDRFDRLLAGADGSLRISQIEVSESNDSIFANSRAWESLTPYCVNRHAKKALATDVITQDVINECKKRRLLRPNVKVIQWSAAPCGLQAILQLTFPQPICGPVILGKTRHNGGGVFRASQL